MEYNDNDKNIPARPEESSGAAPANAGGTERAPRPRTRMREPRMTTREQGQPTVRDQQTSPTRQMMQDHPTAQRQQASNTRPYVPTQQTMQGQPTQRQLTPDTRHAPQAGRTPQQNTPVPQEQQRRRQAQSQTRRSEPEYKLRLKQRRRHTFSTVVGRVLLVIFTFILVMAFALVALCSTLVNGPSETVRDLVVLSAMQASATKWLPGLFLDDALVEEIVARSANVNEEVIPMGAFVGKNPDGDPGNETGDTPGTSDDPGTDTPPVTPADPWEDAIDGMIYKTYNGSTFKAYILLVRDPSRVYVGTSSDYKSGKKGSRIFDMVEREGAIAAINAGEFADPNGQGTGDNPIGLTYSKGACVWDDGKRRTFIGFDSDGVLHAVEGMKKSEAEALGIRDAVSFQTGNVLISNDGESVMLHYAEGNVGMAQRTAIAQRADGTVILLVTDGRSASSLGATRNDVIDLLVSEGAVVAGMLDGGSSTMMYYEDYYTKYDVDTSGLDEYQRMGLTNRYKAFTTPRRMPTYFLVSPEK